MSINIKADFTCDNSYAIWVGNANGVVTKIKEYTNVRAHEIWQGEHFTFQAEADDYLYVIAWSDDATLQGLIGAFDGGVSIQMGDPAWKVLPTNSNKGNNQFPTLTEINGFVTTAAASDWKDPYIGPTNANTSNIYGGVSSIAGIPLDANWVWHNSNNSPNPFRGYNHEEFLIFRIPIEELTDDSSGGSGGSSDGCCSPCANGKKGYNEELGKRAKEKEFVVQGEQNPSRKVKEPYNEKMCSVLEVPELKPSFYLHWGDSSRDIFESHDDEVLYITACNNYHNVTFKDLTILQVTITPEPGVLSNGEKEMSLVPDRLICFDTLKGCSCASREFTMLLRGVKPQKYTIEVEYCIGAVELKQEENSGKNSFTIEVFNS